MAQAGTSDTARTAAPGEAASTRNVCFRGQPLPRCRQFAIVEAGVAVRLAGTTHEFPPHLGGRQPDGGSRAGYELGWMLNRDSARAIGATLRVMPGDGGTSAISARHRWWKSRGRTVDVSAGVARGLVSYERDQLLERRIASGVTAEVTLGVSDMVAVSLSGDALRGAGRSMATVHAGARVGSHLAAVATGVLLAWFVVHLATLGDNY